ncbi:UDP-N-acetylglucosamine-peptide N-acetylglucosaminyltransferase [Dyella monticola]|uniref:protein O-GlcNAc transferase n=1 Tax=Dyella monticola TaxID=1927958 RepID=A0A370X451_9GAMM|nr:tetratricopeptide repeat protein [Dyella monticola]RDS83116.1 UDP-N-acetylglucosamine-peptide N-acetylglucosaminyltransferase [Dyella monticola]
MTDALPTDVASALQKVSELLQRDANEEAAHAAALARRAFPVAAELIRLHGVALLRLGRRREAQTAMNRAAEIAPDNVELQCNLASLSMADGRVGAAIERLQKAMAKTPGHPALLQALGTAYMSTGQHVQARDLFALAVKNLPEHPVIRLNLAVAELELGRLSEAEALLRQVLHQAPEIAVAHVMLGHALHAQRRSREAAAALLQAGKLEPNNVQPAYQAALLLDEAGDLPGAHDAFTDALARAPDSVPVTGQLLYLRRRLCRWHDIDALSERVLQAVANGEPGIHPFSFLAEDADAAFQLQCAKTYAGLIEAQAAPFRQQANLRHSMPLPDTPIRVGMLSDGFHETPVGQHLVGLIEKLADSDLDIHLFATTPDDGSAVRRRLSSAATLHDVSRLNSAQVAARIHATGIEILFDLNGYRGRGNAEMLALQPAPVQVSWLGYAGSSGAPWMDYLLTDAITLPPELREHVSEKVVRLPRCHQPNDPNRAHSQAPSRVECGLPEEGVVFACFCETHALNPGAFARWMLILQQVPDSVLWLLTGPANTDERLRQAAQALDVAPERLVFLPRLPYPDYLARFAHVDLYLDTLPVHSRAAASDALWAGCPVLTRTGETMASRTVTSLLHHLGLPELILAENTSYIGMATALGNDPDALAALRRHIAQQRDKHSLFDMQGFATDFRRAVMAISARYRIGRPPKDIDL